MATVDRALAVVAVGVLMLAAVGCAGDDEQGSPPSPRIVDSSTIEGKLERACSRVHATKDIAALCPTWLPSARAGFDAYRGYSVSQDDFERRRPCEYLTQLGYSGEGAGTKVPFHVLFGGRCREWPMAVRGGRWPARPGKRAGLGDGRLRMVNVLGVPGHDAEVVRPRVVGTSTVRGSRALVLWFAPHPRGGIHGGHYGVAWNWRGSGYAITLHYDRGDRTHVGRGNAMPPGKSERRALLEAARGMVSPG